MCCFCSQESSARTRLTPTEGGRLCDFELVHRAGRKASRPPLDLRVRWRGCTPCERLRVVQCARVLTPAAAQTPAVPRPSPLTSGAGSGLLARKPPGRTRRPAHCDVHCHGRVTKRQQGGLKWNCQPRSQRKRNSNPGMHSLAV